MITKLSAAILVTSLAATLNLSGLARAQTPAGADPSSPSVVVRYSDLDLSTRAGIRTLYARIRSAAWQVCHDIVPRGASVEGGKCRQALVDDAVARVDKSAFTAVQTGKEPLDLRASR